MESQYFTKEGLEKLKEEYTYRTGQLRGEIAVRIKEAKEQGDISENAEFAEAKDAQSHNEGRIEELKRILDTAVVFTNGGSKSHVVDIGSRVKVQVGKEVREFTIVGAAEADPTEGKISNESPLGAALLGLKKGSSATVRTPKGETTYKVLEVK
ncbi:MAG TPA: transcription elongation factor GreA [Candidatus Paceibacterota bacterium]|nr:transcription elongation factor GreA [Candidatus Paceibacterota bacterium]